MKLLCLAMCLLLCSCSAKHASKVLIPANCMHVTIKDFTKPCELQEGGSLLCNGVRVRANCVAVAK